MIGLLSQNDVKPLECLLWKVWYGWLGAPCFGLWRSPFSGNTTCPRVVATDWKNMTVKHSKVHPKSNQLYLATMVTKALLRRFGTLKLWKQDRKFQWTSCCINMWGLHRATGWERRWGFQSHNRWWLLLLLGFSGSPGGAAFHSPFLCALLYTKSSLAKITCKWASWTQLLLQQLIVCWALCLHTVPEYRPRKFFIFFVPVWALLTSSCSAK